MAVATLRNPVSPWHCVADSASSSLVVLQCQHDRPTRQAHTARQAAAGARSLQDAGTFACTVTGSTGRCEAAYRARLTPARA
jgi:hypothetical protein